MKATERADGKYEISLGGVCHVVKKAQAIELAKSILKASTAEEKCIRTMTPFENQWMDFKKILSELVVYVHDYQEQTRDFAPGNRYWGDKLLGIANSAAKAIGAKPLSLRQISEE